MIIIKSILSFLAVCLFVSNKHICDLVHGDDLDNWWPLRMNLYAVLFALIFIISNIDGKNKFINFIISIGIGFAISDVIDRIYFDINTFTTEDIVMIVIIIALSYYTHVKRNKR